VVVTLPACVIPLAPDFQDPPAAENSPPYIVSSSPDQGSLVTSTTRFGVRVTDPNPGDDLSIRWYADFPPLQPSTRAMGADVGSVPHSADGTVQTTLLEAVVSCQGDNLAPGISQHTVTVVVSDVELGPGTPTFDGTHQVTATWLVLLQCPTSLSP
jgi:hypothetical protein